MGIVQSGITGVVNNMSSIKAMSEEKVEIVIENQEEDEIKIDMSNVKREPSGPDDWIRMDIGYGIDSRYEVHDMYMTIKRLELEDWIKNTDWCNIRYSKESDMISNGLEDNNHSGASYGGCMWRTKEVFEKGWYPMYCKEAQINV